VAVSLCKREPKPRDDDCPHVPGRPERSVETREPIAHPRRCRPADRLDRRRRKDDLRWGREVVRGNGVRERKRHDGGRDDQ